MIFIHGASRKPKSHKCAAVSDKQKCLQSFT